ncbi:uncharacterized protein LOC135613531 [Musa acuminata AAA Group]|uniref:uncharacterized protein LOC135613531 n=1 Tax=Musa acuminata AAA Group TaxID=214697 RepID=UPI0031DBFB58
MRLASFLQCGCGAPRPEEKPQAARTGTDPRDRGRRRRSRGNDASKPWRPSLAAISENGAPTRAAAGARDGKMTADGAEKHKAVVSRRVLPRDHSDHDRILSLISLYSPAVRLAVISYYAPIQQIHLKTMGYDNCSGIPLYKVFRCFFSCAGI